jgi:lysozyme
MNAEAEKIIKQWEGLRLKAYLDTGGVWTIGWGHTKNVDAGMTITEEQAQKLFEEDYAEHARIIKKHVKVPLNEFQEAALISFAFNVGEPQFAKSTLLKKLNKGEYESVPAQLQRWIYDNGKVVKGLVNRRAAEAGLWAKGDFVSSNYQSVDKPKKDTPVEQVVLGSAGALGTLFSAVADNPILSGAIGVAIVALVALFVYKRWKDD